LWNRHYVDHIQITMAEDFGVAGRGRLYDGLGTIRDVVENHLLQVIALLTMEAPSGPSAGAHHDEVVALLRDIEPVATATRGQYVGYQTEDGVAADSTTETYAALRFEIASLRWSGVPVYVRAGKMLPCKATTADVVFKPLPAIPFLGADDVTPPPNRLTFGIGPSERIVLRLQGKAPGDTNDLASIDLDFELAAGGPSIMSAYERLLAEVFEADRSMFAREDAVEQAWRIVAPLLGSTETPGAYDPGSWGPANQDGLMEDVTSWIDPCAP